MTRRSRPATRRRRPVEVTDWRVILGGDDRDSGIFAADDFAAIDLLDVADALEVRVPEALSVVGFDDVEIARLRRINLTTVH